MGIKSSGFLSPSGPVWPNADRIDEADLALRFIAGDTGATEVVFYAYFDRLFTLIYHSVGKDRAAAEDIIQETFLSALKSAKNFQARSKLYTWLVSIAHHKIVDYYRHQEVERKHFNHFSNDPPGEKPEIVDESLSVSDMVEHAESNDVIEKALMSLPVDYRQVLLLKYVEDMPVAEICQVMKRSPKSVEGLLTRSRKALRGNITAFREG